MKCDNCGNATAVFHYTANINDKETERHLCMKCATEEGLASAMFRITMLPNTAAFDSMFRSVPYAAGRVPPTFAAPDICGNPTVSDEPGGSAGLIPTDAGEGFRRKREIAKLRAEMQTAIGTEAFEQAAILRDEISELEKEIEKV